MKEDDEQHYLGGSAAWLSHELRNVLATVQQTAGLKTGAYDNEYDDDEEYDYDDDYEYEEGEEYGDDQYAAGGGAKGGNIKVTAPAKPKNDAQLEQNEARRGSHTGAHCRARRVFIFRSQDIARELQRWLRDGPRCKWSGNNLLGAGALP